MNDESFESEPMPSATCADVRARADELPGDGWLSRHVAACAACRAFVDAYGPIATEFGRMRDREPPRPPVHVAAHARAAIAARRPRHTTRLRVAAALIGFASVLAVQSALDAARPLGMARVAAAPADDEFARQLATGLRHLAGTSALHGEPFEWSPEAAFLAAMHTSGGGEPRKRR